MSVIQKAALSYVDLAQSHPILVSTLLGIGSLTLLKFVLQTLFVFLQIFVLPGQNIKRFGAKKGAWAVVTGASDGIGKEFAFQLAKVGYNVLLVARNKDLLVTIASEISTKFAVRTQIFTIDFSKNDASSYDSLTKTVEGLDIGVLVNNVGKSHSMPVYFVDTPKDEMDDIVAINISGTLRVTYSVLPGMIQRKRGLILNIGSFAGAIPSPMLATYSGTKAFLTTFTSALAEEVKASNIVVEHVNTYFVVSKLSKIRKPSAFIPLPSSYVKTVLSKVGLACGAIGSGRPNTSTPYWTHAIMDYARTVIGIPSLFISYTHGLHKDIRRRALRKMERDAKKQ
ncbi:NAD(P)-binding protein [Guyanagaster necrorhizus]|uniref:Very-long-chain 3-oxoacyl-CoA reductase n=1 Tax=Guyanagaster necrorhizus TaxID=856835 RepID=A0A9P8AQS1_9AGAR|nr:NAD(P)-binding protein [Guyanagaster necrorhizus MCA 3950]KAG7444305.1 NAD(P)-binding protein [Guyanagaster necrorhizus MCA 3950]